MYALRIKKGENQGKFVKIEGSKRPESFNRWDKYEVTDNFNKARIFKQINHLKTSEIYCYFIGKKIFDDLLEIVELELKIK